MPIYRRLIKPKPISKTSISIYKQLIKIIFNLKNKQTILMLIFKMKTYINKSFIICFIYKKTITRIIYEINSV